MTSQKYQHDPLPNASTSMRLLSMEPGWPSDPLRVQLKVITDRSAAPPYDALSYCWGKELSANPVMCNGSPTTVTENLASALFALRPLPTVGEAADHGIDVLDSDHLLHSSQREWKAFARNLNEAKAIESRRVSVGPGQSQAMIWIDALCINQADLDECAEQVKGMRSIYKSAQTVRIWLGARLVTPEGIPCVFPDMKTRKLDAALGRIRLAGLGHMPVILSFLAQALRNEGEHQKCHAELESDGTGALLRERGFPPSSAPEWGILRAFLEQPWFHRVWIIQEAVMAQNAVIMMGDWEFEWEAFARAVKILKDSGLEVSRSLSLYAKDDRESWQGIELSSVQYITEIRNMPDKLNYLLPLLNNARGRKATKALDHVFALLGIAAESVSADERLKALINIDYKKPTAHVFRDVAWFIILTHRTLYPLLLVELTDQPSTKDCPSWVPNWDQPRKSVELAHEIYNVDLGRMMEMGMHDINALRVSGYEFERIRVVSIELENTSYDATRVGARSGWHYPPRKEEIEFVTSAWSQVKSYQASETGNGVLAREYQSRDDIWQAFIYTLCANRNSNTDNGRADTTGEIMKSAKFWFDKYVDQFSQTSSFLSKARSTIEESLYRGTRMAFQSVLLAASFSRRFFMTSSGFMGIGPASLKENDLVVIALGVPMPLVLRQSTTSPEKFQVIGVCYVHGIMDGELLEAYGGRPPSRFIFI